MAQESNVAKPRTFEVAIFNKTVMDMLHRGERHPNLREDWAETHYFRTIAYTADEARRKFARKYPADLGYVIDDVILIED
jgi:hypothetical protein